MKKEFLITLDLVKTTAIPKVAVKKSDLESVKFNFRVLNGGAVADLTGATVQLAVLKPSQLTVFEDCTITDPVNGECELVLSNQSYIEVGTHTGELYITQNAELAITNSFDFASQETIMTDTTLESSNDWQAIQDILIGGGGIAPPQTGAADPTGAPDYIGQTYVNTTSGEAFVATTALGGWQTISMDELGGGGGSVTWDAVTEKPTTFVPSAHDHVWADITDAPTTMTPTAHGHVIADISGLTTALNSKLEAIPAEYLTESEGDLRYAAIGAVGAGIEPPKTGAADPTGAPDYIGQTYVNTTSGEAFVATTALGGWQSISMDELGGGAGTVTWDSVTEKPATFAPSAHDHVWANITDAPTTMTPTAHTHDFVTDITNKPLTYPPDAHGHGIGEITNLSLTLDGKSDTGHAHVWADITDAPTTMTPTAHTHDYVTGITNKPISFPPSAHDHVWADITDAPTTMTPTAHIHAITDVTNLDTTLNAKQPKPTTGTAAPVSTPTHIGAMEIDTTNKRTYVAEGVTAADWRRLAGTNYVDTATNFIEQTVLDNLSLWSGTQAEYDALTPVATTLYFIVG